MKYKVGDIVVVLSDSPVCGQIDTIGQITKHQNGNDWFQVTFRKPPDIVWFTGTEVRPATDKEVLAWRLTK